MTAADIIKRISRATPDQLDEIADGMQSIAYLTMANGDCDDAERVELCALCVRNLADNKRKGRT